MSDPSFLAFDLGAESGRAIRGALENGVLSLAELSRFPNGMLELGGRLHWNVYRLFEEMLRALAACSGGGTGRGGGAVESVGVDTWGVDFGLLAPDGSLLGLPYAYRDAHTDGAMESFFQRMPRERVYALTGIQFLRFNTLFQLHALQKAGSPLLAAASDLLFMPDLFNYFLTGEKRSELTFATTSQLYNPETRGWEEDLFAACEVPRSLMQDIVPPGTVIGRLRSSIARATGVGPIPVAAVASHDTASAVAAVPAEGEGWAYISSGTWSLMGVERASPAITAQALAMNFTNEAGAAGTFTFLKNIMGLWLLQQCRRAWAAERELTYGELAKMAEAAEPFRSLIDPDRAAFLNPPDMPAAIAGFCAETGQPEPRTPAELTRCIFESLALRYRLTLEQLRRLDGRPIDRIHVIGGGARNAVLCRYTADATGLPVIAGPDEATAAGNIMIQALAAGRVDSLAAVRRVISRSFELVRYEPRPDAGWDRAYARFRELAE